MSRSTLMSPEVPPVNPTVPSQPIPQNQGRRFANGTAPSGSNNLPASAQSRLHTQKHDPPLRLHDPYGPTLSFSEFRDIVRYSLTIPPEPTPPQNQEAGQASTRKRPRSLLEKAERWWEFILMLIRPIFSFIQMRLPSMYFRRVAAIIRKSEISMADFASIKQRTNLGFLGMVRMASGVSMPKIHEVHSMQRFKKKWKAFVMRCMEEWRNLNLISTLLMSILLTFLQIDEAGLHPFTRLSALLSLECAFMSLLYGTWYIGRFHSLRDVEKGMSWIFAAAQTSTPLYWNMWLFLALPAVWLAWSLIFFSTGLLSFIWTSGDRRVPALAQLTDETMEFMPMSFKDFTPLWPRIILTAVLTFGLGMGVFVSNSFKDVDPMGTAEVEEG